MKRTSDFHKKTYITAGVLSIAGCFLMISFPTISLAGVRAGLNLFMDSVLPTLFPFFILVNFMGDLGIPERIAHLFDPLFRRLFRSSGLGAFVWIFSLFSGYPMASRLVGEYTRNGTISSEEGKRILSFSCVSGPLFMVGTVGTVMLGNTVIGYLIAMGHYLGAFLNGLLFCHWILPVPVFAAHGGGSSQLHVRDNGGSVSVFESMSRAIFKAFQTLGLVLGYMILFSMISEFLRAFDGFRFLSRPWMEALAKGTLEMTIGCNAVSELTGISGPFRLALCGFILAFGGCSIAGQSLSMLTGSGIEGRDYFTMKLSQGMISGIVTYILTVFAQNRGLLDLSASLIYGSENQGVQWLGRIHTVVFSVKSMVVIGILMVALVGIDHGIQKVYYKIHTYIERRNQNL